MLAEDITPTYKIFVNLTYSKKKNNNFDFKYILKFNIKNLTEKNVLFFCILLN